MSDERERNEPRDRQGEGEPDFEGHRFIEKQGEKFIERHDG